MEKIRKLKQQIKEEYGVCNANLLADALNISGYAELSDEIREKILFLQQICIDFSLDEYWVASLVANNSLEDIKKRYMLYVKYTRKSICKVDGLVFSCEKEAAYVSMLMKLGLDDSQINCVMSRIIEHGSIAKSEEDARDIVADLGVFELPEEIRNQFICDNADYLFNDYSREAKQVFDILCQRYGKEKGFICLQEHPEYIRFGVKYIQ